MPLASRIVAVLLIASTALALAHRSEVLSFAFNIPAHFAELDRHVDIAYGAEERLQLDVYVPGTGCNRPVVIFWYGGLWIQGAKSDYGFVGAALARAGYVAVLPDYRLFPQVKYPSFGEDGARVVRWVYEHIAQYGGDPDQIFLAGHSAGAHIAASIALDDRYLRDAGVDAAIIRGLIGLSGPYVVDPDHTIASRGICFANERCKRLMAQIFAEKQLTPDWQPTSAAADNLAVLLIHGREDVLTPMQHAEFLRDRLLTAGVATEALFYDEVGHEATVLGFAVPMVSPVLQDVRRFIERNSRGTSPCSPIE